MAELTAINWSLIKKGPNTAFRNAQCSTLLSFLKQSFTLVNSLISKTLLRQAQYITKALSLALLLPKPQKEKFSFSLLIVIDSKRHSYYS